MDKVPYKYPNEDIENEVTLIQIMGTWCPNCLDESVYLAQLRKKYPDDLNIISITFETQKSMDDKIAKVDKFRTVLGLDWTFLIGGDACKKCAADLFPQLNSIISFPTLLFIDKKGMARRIHTGFSGPGTGEYYTSFVEETDAFIEMLVNE